MCHAAAWNASLSVLPHVFTSCHRPSSHDLACLWTTSQLHWALCSHTALCFNQSLGLVVLHRTQGWKTQKGHCEDETCGRSGILGGTDGTGREGTRGAWKPALIGLGGAAGGGLPAASGRDGITGAGRLAAAGTGGGAREDPTFLRGPPGEGGAGRGESGGCILSQSSLTGGGVG